MIPQFPHCDAAQVDRGLMALRCLALRLPLNCCCDKLHRGKRYNLGHFLKLNVDVSF